MVYLFIAFEMRLSLQESPCLTDVFRLSGNIATNAIINYHVTVTIIENAHTDSDVDMLEELHRVISKPVLDTQSAFKSLKLFSSLT